MGAGWCDGRRGFWTRPRAAGESMEEVIYMRRQTAPRNFFLRATDIDNAALSQNTDANKDGGMTLREIWISLKDLFASQCPDCGSPMTSMLDMERDKLIYHCDKCGKYFIAL